jgi:Thioesterase domain
VANFDWNSRKVFGNDGRGTQLHYLLWSAETTGSAKASEYIRAMREIKSNGPYYIGGARIAFEMTQNIRGQGQEVNLLVIIDPWVLENTQNRKPWRMYYYSVRLRQFLASTVGIQNGNRAQSHPARTPPVFAARALRARIGGYDVASSRADSIAERPSASYRYQAGIRQGGPKVRIGVIRKRSPRRPNSEWVPRCKTFHSLLVRDTVLL